MDDKYADNGCHIAFEDIITGIFSRVYCSIAHLVLVALEQWIVCQWWHCSPLLSRWWCMTRGGRSQRCRSHWGRWAEILHQVAKPTGGQNYQTKSNYWTTSHWQAFKSVHSDQRTFKSWSNASKNDWLEGLQTPQRKGWDFFEHWCEWHLKNYCHALYQTT